MRISSPLLFLLPSLASAVLTKLKPGFSPEGAFLAARAGCTIHSTCDECYGDGYVICSEHYCFNPGKGQQCCANGSYCIAKSNDCCDSGPGKTGQSGNPVPLATDFRTPTASEGAVITCAASNKKYNDGQECCKGYNATWSFCPNSAGCYLLQVETCCTDGSICEGEDCCDLVDAKATTPFPSGPQQTGDAGTSGSMTTAGAPGEKTVTVTDGGVSTSTPTGAAVTNALGGAMVVAMGVLGVAML
ncbi:hypothetical protein V496_06224 [Pseudogymnoascus sp. VKM F-4515 (FW-2607)]|nr:hypothetical protein V496_06224 [Pseudogymnoascus sp. VKM F-4515 (FW-2607)]